MRVDEMPAGGKLNCLIAERLFNWEDAGWDPLYCRFVGHPTKERYRWYEQVPDYSTDIARAWEVVEKMDKLGFRYAIGNTSTSNGEMKWHRAMFQRSYPEPFRINYKQYKTSKTPSAPLAICRAALKAMGVTEC